MGYTAIPGGDVWLQIGSTQTPTSGSVVTFSSVPAVKALRLVVFSVDQTAASVLGVTLNNDTATNYWYGYIDGIAGASKTRSSSNTYLPIGSGSGTTFMFADFLINYANQKCPKLITGGADDKGTSTGRMMASLVANYNSTSTISRVDITSISSTFSATNTGTIALYGAF